MDKTLKEEFQKKFGSEIVYSLSLTKDDVPGWDSMRYISFLVALEKKCQLKFSSEATATMKSLQDVLNYVIEHQKNDF